MAMIDGLTGLANRRQFDLSLASGIKHALASGEPLSLMMIDVDYFKRYNDTSGMCAAMNVCNVSRWCCAA